MASERIDDPGTSAVARVLPFLAAVLTATVTYAGLRDTWMRAPEITPYVGTSPRTIRLLILLIVPISPHTWIGGGPLYFGFRKNRDLLPDR
ncbi:MAG: hypothetical protein ABEH78_09395 [Haloferacaceae archaeon]